MSSRSSGRRRGELVDNAAVDLSTLVELPYQMRGTRSESLAVLVAKPCTDDVAEPDAAGLAKSFLWTTSTQ